MSFKDYQAPPRVPVSLPRGQSVTVRGLTLEDIAFFVNNHLGEITRAVETFMIARASMNNSKSLSAFILTLAKDFPKLTAEIISVAADEPEQVETVRRLPMFTQITALTAIMKATLEDTAELKNLLAGLREVAKTALAQTAKMQPEPPTSESQSFTSGSEGM